MQASLVDISMKRMSGFMNESEKMKAGMWYDANNDPELLKKRLECKELCFELNQTRPKDTVQQDKIIEKLLGYLPEGLVLLPPFQCDYGCNIHLGNDVFINHYAYLMDGADIRIGNHVFIGPYCGFYTANHPLPYKPRNQGLEKALPIIVGDNCWIGANVSIMPGVKIGQGCVIAAGAVVTRDLPENSLAAGIPAKVIRTIDQNE